VGWKSKLAKTAVVLVVVVAAVPTYFEMTRPKHPVLQLPTAGKLMLTGVTVVDTRSGQLSPGMSVLMDGGRITQVFSGEATSADASIPRVALLGKFVVPGFNEMHAHPLNDADPSGNLALMLANGITGFRQMTGTAHLLEARRSSRLPIGEAAPSLLQMPGSVLTPLNAGSISTATKTVREQAEQGADFIKVVLVSPLVFAKVLEEARRLKLPVAGHIPVSLDIVSAAKAGMRAVEHLGPSSSGVIACSTTRAQIQAELDAESPIPGLPFRLPYTDELSRLALERIVHIPAVMTSPEDSKRRSVFVPAFDVEQCREVARQLSTTDNWQVPTLIRRKASELADDPAFASNPNLRYVPRKTIEAWQAATKRYIDKVPADARKLYHDEYAVSLKMLKIFDEEGVKMLAGSDQGGAWLVPGFALHQEFDELSAAGLSPLRILQMTTINAAEFLGRLDTMGTVEVGKDADLVILDADPIADAANLHRISGVVRRGVYFDRAALDSLLARYVQ
jgi:imidazolonepropionase-like amidohydrolase